MIPEPKEKNKSSDIRRLPEWFKVKAPGSENYLLMAILLAFIMGSMQLLFGLFRLGFLVNFLINPPQPKISSSG